MKHIKCEVSINKHSLKGRPNLPSVNCFSHSPLLLFTVIRKVQEKDDDVVFVYESRILTTAIPEFCSNVFTEEDSDSSFVFDLQKKDSNSEMQTFNNTQMTEDNSVIFVPENTDVINILSNSTLDDSLEITRVSQEIEVNQKISQISIIDSDEEEPSKSQKKKKPALKPLVVMEKLPDELFVTESHVNIKNNKILEEHLNYENELLNFKSDINIQNLALHGETSRAKRLQRLSLKKRTPPTRKIQRRQTQVVAASNINVDRSINSLVKNRRTYCAFCEEWVMDIKEHRKQHDIVKSFTCEVCGKKYGMQAHLTQHFRKKHREVLFC